MNMHNYVFGFFLLVTFSAAGFAAQDADPPVIRDQRDCGAVEPVAPPSVTAAATTVKSSKSNSSERQGQSVTPPPVPGDVTAVAATSVKSGKSNSSDRQAKSVTPPPVPAEASNLNQSKSNINREVEDESSGAVEDPDCGR